MTGVEVLAMEEVAIEFAFNWNAFFISFGIAFVFLALIGLAVYSTTKETRDILIGAILGVTFGFIFGTVFGSVTKIPTEYESQYKVIISDEVSMNEFIDRYEIIEQDGKIYTVVERD